MGIVYRALDEQLEREVALKVLPGGGISQEVGRKKFRREALNLAKLNHPNIATVFEFGTHRDVNFLVMELIPGISLHESLKSGPLSEQEILRLGLSSRRLGRVPILRAGQAGTGAKLRANSRCRKGPHNIPRFLHHLERRRPRHPHLERGQGRVREAAISPARRCCPAVNVETTIALTASATGLGRILVV